MGHWEIFRIDVLWLLQKLMYYKAANLHRNLCSCASLYFVVKVLNSPCSEMDLAKIRFIRKALIKEKGAEVFRKIHWFPILWKPFKATATAPSHTAVGYLETSCQRRTQLCQRPFITTYSCRQRHMNKYWNLFRMAQWRFYSKPECYYSLKATAQWTLHDIGNGAMNSSTMASL